MTIPIQNGHRIIQGLFHAALSDECPHAAKRKRGSKAQGLTYQKKIARVLKRDMPEELVADQWIRFQDANGHGYAQPDFYSVFEDRVVLFEAKLTQNDSAKDQCLKLYAPLLTYIYGRPVVSCQVFRNIRYRPAGLITDWRELLALPAGYYNWHNMGDV
jgi:hypothetical protein